MFSSLSRWPVALVILSLAAPLQGAIVAAAAEEGGACLLTRSGAPQCAIVFLSNEPAGLLMVRAAAVINDAVRRWGAAELPTLTLGESSPSFPDHASIVLATLESLQKAAPEVVSLDDAILRVGTMDEHGFVCVPLQFQEAARVFVVGRTPRGVYNGAQYVRDYLIDGTADALVLDLTKVVRTPGMPARAVYALTIWGHEDEYTASDWERIFDSFSRDGFDRVYFWLSGHFPSKKFPQTYKVKDDNLDSTEDSKIGTVEDQQRLIRYAHDVGLKFYVGGALGGWIGTRFLTNLEPGTMTKRPKGVGYDENYTLCPSDPQSRKALVEYYVEMFDALPEADGVYIESADEWGGCFCQRCSKPVDTLGSRQFGQAQLTLLQEIAAAIWENHPHARFAYTIGYSPHREDPAYYDVVHQMSDPRFEWMEARDSWTFPGPDGKPKPARTVSPRVMRWRQYYSLPLEQFVSDANRAADAGFYGLITAFEPGFGTASFYTEIPYPTDILPYVLTGFAFREVSWDPAMTLEDLQERIRKRFFGKEADAQLAKDFGALRSIIGDASVPDPAPETKKQILVQLEGMKRRLEEARPKLGPKSLDAVELMARAINDTRRHLEQEAPASDGAERMEVKD